MIFSGYECDSISRLITESAITSDSIAKIVTWIAISPDFVTADKCRVFVRSLEKITVYSDFFQGFFMDLPAFDWISPGVFVLLRHPGEQMEQVGHYIGKKR